MIGLSEEEAAALAAAKASALAAKIIIDRLQKKSRDARLEEILKLKRMRRSTKPSILPEKLQERQDFPKPASHMPQHRKNRWNWKPPASPESKAVRETFDLVRSFGGLAAAYSLDRAQTKQALQDAGIDICEEVARDWDRGISIHELSRRHGTGRDTIARWIKKTGRAIIPRNGNWRYDEALIAKTFDETGSVNKAAKAAEVSWDTARSVLSRYGIRAEGRSKHVSVSRLGAEITRQSSPHS
ncbi:hypothetical protein [Paracoccus aminovorans]|uniref:hypothetical protein n=1 Tax=Paracoccus aminovorans TaxID=34004 RepID=UPI000ABC813D|nr:hypothetical protein [Paracoccus aminovorans]